MKTLVKRTQFFIRHSFSLAQFNADENLFSQMFLLFQLLTLKKIQIYKDLRRACEEVLDHICIILKGWVIFSGQRLNNVLFTELVSFIL